MTFQVFLIAIAVAAAIIGIVRFEVFCVGDLSQTPDTQLLYLTRAGWLVLILLLVPIGGIAYLYYGKWR